MNVKIFYAWQSDGPRKVTRDLIGTAAKDACERMSNDNTNSWTLELDSDTQNVAGMCDIPNTILEKIAGADVFLADLTFVAQTNDGKKMPNANVIFELGFAAKCLGFDALIGVMNTAFGEPEGQVFDIKRRAAVRFNCDDTSGSERKSETERLSRELEGVLRLTMKEVVEKRRAKDLAAMTQVSRMPGKRSRFA